MVDIQHVLSYIPVSELEYHEWIHVGMALKEMSKSDPSITWKTWEDWSREDSRFKEGECEKKWNSFKGSGITKNTLYKLARENGYKESDSFDNQEFLSWDDDITLDGKYKVNPIEAHQKDDLIRYIEALFEPDDIVSYCLDAVYDEDKKKYHPGSGGVIGVKASKLIRDLERYKGDIPQSFGEYNKEAGGWIRINPMDGEGIYDKNVAKFKYALVENDELSTEEQLNIIRDLKIPCAAVVFSGDRSVHAIVRIDAKNRKEYDERVNWLYNTLESKGFKVDPNNKNPSRMSRLPTLQRGDKLQKLIDINIGHPTFEEFQKSIMRDEILGPLEIESFSEMQLDPPELADELIEGVLRQGHKMLISGPSKAGKSFALIELAIALAEGKEWMGFKCRQGKVLYINLEIDRASFYHRIDKVYGKMELQASNDMLSMINLRGRAVALDTLVDTLLLYIKKEDFKAIILDPIYKVQTGDENAAGDIAKFTNQLDRITNELGVSLIYCHHHSKGYQGNKRAIDRSSGSGVFSRDPDAIIDMIEIDDKKLHNIEDLQGCTFWRVEGTLREFKAFKPFNVIFRFPIHEVDMTGRLNSAEIVDGFRNNFKSTAINKEPAYMEFYNAFDSFYDNEKKSVPIKDIAGYLGIKETTVKRRMTTYNEQEGKVFFIKNGCIFKQDTDTNETENETKNDT